MAVFWQRGMRPGALLPGIAFRTKSNPYELGRFFSSSGAAALPDDHRAARVRFFLRPMNCAQQGARISNKEVGLTHLDEVLQRSSGADAKPVRHGLSRDILALEHREWSGLMIVKREVYLTAAGVTSKTSVCWFGRTNIPKTLDPFRATIMKTKRTRLNGGSLIAVLSPFPRARNQREAIEVKWQASRGQGKPAVSEPRKLSHEETLQLDSLTKNKAWRLAKKTRPILARPVEPDEVGKEIQTADHVKEKARAGVWLGAVRGGRAVVTVPGEDRAGE